MKIEVSANMKVWTTVTEEELTSLVNKDSLHIRHTDGQGRLHNEAGPAYIYPQSKGGQRREWRVHGVFCNLQNGPTLIDKDGVSYTHNPFGVLHDKDKPSAIKPDGTEVYYWYGKVGRPGDDPAIIMFGGKNDVAYWMFNDVITRDNGKPAIVHSCGVEEFFVNGLRHRVNGPAIENWKAPKKNQYWLFGVLYTKDGFDSAVEEMKKQGILG
jgi:hypothetical protein